VAKRPGQCAMALTPMGLRKGARGVRWPRERARAGAQHGSDNGGPAERLALAREGRGLAFYSR
jgi:hypothetical protein